MSVIPALGRLRQEGGEFETNLSYIARACLKKKKKRERERERERERKGKASRDQMNECGESSFLNLPLSA
jgi:hypothetical protein